MKQENLDSTKTPHVPLAIPSATSPDVAPGQIPQKTLPMKSYVPLLTRNSSVALIRNQMEVF